MSRLAKPSRTARMIVKELQEEQRRQRSTSPFANSGLSVPAPGTTQVTGNLWVTGDFTADGKITNAALINPVIPGQQFIGRNTFGVTVAGAYVLTRTATVPAGCDTVTVTAYGRVIATNSTGSADYLYTALDVNGTGGNQFAVDIPAGKFSTSSVGFATTLTGLTPGDPVVTGLYTSTGLASWASSGSNAADLSVTYLWTR